MSNTQVLIVGAGPVGLTAALALLKQGINVRIVEKSANFHVGIRGVGIQPRTLEIVKILGILPDYLDKSIEPLLLKLHDGKTIVKTWEFLQCAPKTPAIPFPNARLLNQATNEAILREHLAKYDVFVEFGTELVSFEQDIHQVVVQLAKQASDGGIVKESLNVEWIIGSDGARGVVRKQLGLSFLGETLGGQAFLVGDIEIQGIDREFMHVYGDQKTGMMTLFPLDEAPLCAIIGTGPPEMIKAVADGSFEDFAKMFDEIRKDDDIHLIGVRWKSYFRPNVRVAEKFGVGRVFIAGGEQDAAHVHSPMGGQGLNTGVQDSVNLAWKMALVAKGLASPKLLESYESERIPIVKEVLSVSTKLHSSFMKDELPKEGKDKPIDGLVRGSKLKQLGLNYRWSDLILDERVALKTFENGEVKGSWNPYGKEGDAVQAGDRAPEAPALIPLDGEGGTVAISDLFSINWHTILVFHPAKSTDSLVIQRLKVSLAGHNAKSPSTSPLIVPYIILPHGDTTLKDLAFKAFVDSEGHARVGYGIGDALEAPIIVIVRPDTFIGAFVSNAEGVDKYFSEILL